jgi:hypothetical protein
LGFGLAGTVALSTITSLVRADGVLARQIDRGRLRPRSSPYAFTIWLAGGGIKPGITIGETDDYSYNIARDPVNIYDLNATILRCLGIDHTRLTYRYQGRYFRVTDVFGHVVQDVLNFDATSSA